MMSTAILIHGDPQLATLLRQSLGDHEVRVSSLKAGLSRINGRRPSAPFVIIESPRGRDAALRALASVAADAYVVMAPRHLLRLTLGKITELVGAIRATPAMKGLRREVSLETFVEEKLKPLVTKMKRSEGHHLYSMLIKEFERPLITLVLKRTNGNQIEAARLLGVNRNTLRKKIRELKIPDLKVSALKIPA